MDNTKCNVLFPHISETVIGLDRAYYNRERIRSLDWKTVAAFATLWVLSFTPFFQPPNTSKKRKKRIEIPEIVWGKKGATLLPNI